MGIRETNMDEVRRIAKTFLMIDYVKTPFSPLVVIHPFTNSGVVPVREGDGIRLVDITKDKNDFSLRLLRYITNIIRNRIDDRDNKSLKVDKKLRRKIEEKKQAHGLKQG